MKKNIKYIIGAVLLIILVFSFNSVQANKNNIAEKQLLAMNEVNTNPKYSIPLTKKENAIVFRINKNTTDQEFLKIMEELKEKDIDIIFNNVARNEDGLITNIEIVVSKQDLSEEFSDANPNGIQPILIKITEGRIYVGYEFPEDTFAFSNGDMTDEMVQIQKMMQKQMQMLQQMRGSSNNNDIFAKFFGNDPMMSNPQKMMQQMMQQMMQDDDAFFSNSGLGNRNAQSQPKVRSNVKMEKHYIVNGKEMTEEEYQKMDKSKIRSLQIYQTQVVSKSYGM